MNPVPLHYVWDYTDVDRAFWKENLEDWLPRRVFDAHTHVNEPEFRVEEMTDENLAASSVLDLAEGIAERYHVKLSGDLLQAREVVLQALEVSARPRPGPELHPRV